MMRSHRIARGSGGVSRSLFSVGGWAVALVLLIRLIFPAPTGGIPHQARSAAGPADCPPPKDCPPAQDKECPVCDATGAAAAAEAKSSAAAAAPNKYSVTLDLRQVLGEGIAIDGLNWKAGTCMPPWKGTNDDVAAGMEPRFAEVLARELAKLPGAPKSPAADATIFQLAGVGSVWDEGFAALRRRVTAVVATFGLDFGGKTWFCGCGKPSADAGPVKSADQFGAKLCTDDEAAACIGAMPASLIGPPATPARLAAQVKDAGVCTTYREYTSSYVEWLIEHRLLSKEFQNFDVKAPDQDVALELLDLLYEAQRVYLRQRWQGIAMMQDPFDLLAIQDLIYTQRPDLIIETGTANGGSSLLWASLLEMMGLEGTKIITIDLNDPAQGFGGDGTRDVTQKPLWKKYVTFLKGLSTDKHVLDAVAEAASKARAVFVLLDSDHTQQVVEAELEAYCKPFVTPGGYCLVEDGKLSRMGTYGGPLQAVQKFLKANPDFTADRSRELMWTQHPMGYLKRESKKV